MSKKKFDVFDFCGQPPPSGSSIALNGTRAFDFVIEHSTGKQLIQYLENVASLFMDRIAEQDPGLAKLHPISRYVEVGDRIDMWLQFPYNSPQRGDPDIFIAPIHFTWWTSRPTKKDPNPKRYNGFGFLELSKSKRRIVHIFFPKDQEQARYGLTFDREIKTMLHSTLIN